MKPLLAIIGGALLLGLMAFIITDITMGEPMSLECIVTGRYYVPPQTHVTTDADGTVSVDIDPEEFHVTVKEMHENRGFDVNTTRHFFNTLTNNQIVRVRATLGRWTQSIHIGGIEP